MQPTNLDLVNAILNNSKLLGIPHKQLDCQAAVEKALSLVGVKVNYRGSNHMWREMVLDRKTIGYAREDNGGQLLPGLIAFHVKDDGGEVKRGYHDSYGNAVHVGIILDDKRVFHSGANGTEIRTIAGSTFNYVAECKHLTYIIGTNDIDPDDPSISAMLADLETAIGSLESIRKRLTDYWRVLYND